MRQLESYVGRLKGIKIRNRCILKTSSMWKPVALPITCQELFAQCLGEMKCRRRISKFGKIVECLIQVSARQRTFGLCKSMRSKRVEERAGLTVNRMFKVQILKITAPVICPMSRNGRTRICIAAVRMTTMNNNK